MNFTKSLLIYVLMLFFLTGCNGTPGSASWGWKRATDPDDVINFLSKKPPYRQIITRAEVTAADKGSYVDYITFYQADSSAGEPNGWGWKRAEGPDDVINFLNKKPPYTQHIKRAEITAVDKGTYTDFIAFYQPGSSSGGTGNWGWKRATDPDDVINFLNKKPPYTQNIKRAEITAANKESYIDFIIFYQTGDSTTTPSWGWKKSTTEDDVKNFLSGEGAYPEPVDKSDVVSVHKATHTEFYVFYTK